MAIAFQEPSGVHDESASVWMDASVLVGMLRSVPAWHEQAACRDRPDVNFFPKRGEPSRPAKEVCRNECPVRIECLAYALRAPEPVGIWGGLSARQRKKRRRQSGWTWTSTLPKFDARKHQRPKPSGDDPDDEVDAGEAAAF